MPASIRACQRCGEPRDPRCPRGRPPSRARPAARVRALARRRPRLPGLRRGARAPAGRVSAGSARRAAGRSGRQRARGLRRAPCVVAARLRAEAPVRRAGGARQRPRPPARRGGARARTRPRLRAGAPRHAPVDARGAPPVPQPRLRRDAAVPREPGARNGLPGARSLEGSDPSDPMKGCGGGLRLRGSLEKTTGKEAIDAMTSLIVRDPFLAAPFRLMDEWLRSTAGNGRVTGFTPTLDVRETSDEYLVLVDLPGVKSQDVTIELNDNMLTISGSRLPVETGEAQLAERPYGSFTRSLTLPKGVDGDQIAAHYHDGVLELHIPKPAEAKPKKIAIGGQEQKAIEK